MLTHDEQETAITQTAADREAGRGWLVYTDDPVMMRKLEKVGAVLENENEFSPGKFYRLEQSQVSLRRSSTGRR